HHDNHLRPDHTRTHSVPNLPTLQPTHHAHTHTHAPRPQSPPQPQTFHTISTTIRIPLAAPAPAQVSLTPPSGGAARAPKDVLSPTMSREEALAQIRERRGRARSLAQGLATPKRVNGDAVRD